MTRSERLWKDGHKFDHKFGTGKIVSVNEMNSTPCSYAGSEFCYVNGFDRYVSLYYVEIPGRENEIIGVLN